MIFRDEKKRVKGISSRSEEWTAKRHVVLYGESLADVQDHLAKVSGRWNGNSSVSSDANDGWDLSAGYNGAMALAKDGWQEGAEMLDARLHAIMPAAGRQARWGYAQAGGSVSIGRYLTGHPKNMRSRRKKEMGAAPVLHIVVNGVASWNVNANHLANYGTALVGLIDRLETTGKRVMLDVVFVTRSYNCDARLSVGWNVKSASEHVDLASIAFSLAHPAAFRRLGFGLMERAPKELETSGYGTAVDVSAEDVPNATDGTMLIDGINVEASRCGTPQDALRLAVEQINKAAVMAGHATIDAPLIDEAEAELLYA